jgi:hypothetical protein
VALGLRLCSKALSVRAMPSLSATLGLYPKSLLAFSIVKYLRVSCRVVQWCVSCW